ncbi:MAG TPA: GNAT family N-acetyltransferase, partial [Thermoplasmata archaeon]|nr:GNAT family N-acetyltransferase [Thermoplasmata archaeon]
PARIFDLDELPAELAPQLAAIRWLDHETPQDLPFVRRLRRSGFPASAYFGVYSVERGQILGHVETLALPYRSGSTPETVLGIADVLTHPDALGHGHARRLLEHVHAREAAAGKRWSFLWTHRSWGAHRLYETLGYRDVYSPPSALRRVGRSGRRPVPTGYTWRRASVRDLRVLERLHASATKDRLGFGPRWRGSFRLKHEVGWRPIGDHRLLRKAGEAVGYAYVTGSVENLAPHEVIVAGPEHAGPMLAALEGEAAGRWLTFRTTTFVADEWTRLERRGYALYRSAHEVLMARALVEPPGAGRDPAEVAADEAYASQRGEMF